ncbi:alpha/beta fold hydrolase [Anatilimnocola floriformis]|uniref:alpha/beta fold hydrolase n=1 Tax=Anatilimnocola floriformis TaxID=2948575 RepID=UPI0020C5A0AA|nr:alpha/beta hydrolase [Anatilimnocola floriformis]
MSETDLPLILLPGMNGDPRVFAPQLKAFPDLDVPKWEQPLSDEEPLTHYAQRLAAKIDPGVPCIIGGASFGGIVSLEVAKHLQAKACVLIASCRSIEALPAMLRLLRPVSALASSRSIVQLARSAHFLTSIETSAVKNFHQLSPRDQSFRIWALQVLLKWQPEFPNCQLHQIHGALDSTFPAVISGADCVIPEAGHLLTLTHAESVNEYLQQVLTSSRGRCG